MEKETLFTAVKWEILETLSHGKKSPLEISKETNSSVSNISQALRFLELANLIKSERITNRDKGKPRVLYSLAQDTAYIIVTAEGLVKKEQINIDDRKKAFLRIWLLEYKNLHPYIEKAIQTLNLEEYDAIMLGKLNLPAIELYVIQKEPGTKPKPEEIKHQNIAKKINYITKTWEEIQENKDDYYVIHDPLQKMSKDNT